MITNWTGRQLADITKGHWQSHLPDKACQTIEIDHRNLHESGLFVALGGATHDGHDFLSELRPTHAALVQKASPDCPAPQLCVTDTLQALHHMAHAAMQETSAKKIAITGSVGKTSTKEALASLLSHFGICHASKGNYNNHIGAPLSMARTPDEAELIIMEMGMNHKGEISPLSHLFAGDIAIITKIADSHIAHFDNLSDIAKAKAEIFDGMRSGVAILPYDDAHFAFLADSASDHGLSVISFGTSQGADFQLLTQATHDSSQSLIIRNNRTSDEINLTTGLRAPHHATTILIALASMHVLGFDWQEATSAFADLREVDGRGNHISLNFGSHQLVMINDSYNAGPASLTASLHHIASLPAQAKGLILTDMLELGEMSGPAHRDLIPLITAIEPECVILIGPEMSALATELSAVKRVVSYQRPDCDIASLIEALQGCDLVLVKGSNGSGAPQIAKALQVQSDQENHPIKARANYAS